MAFDAVNRLGESPQITQEKQNKEKDAEGAASFFDTLNAKEAESSETMRCRRRNEMWINQVRKHRMDAEHMAWRERHEKYVKMLRASSLKRSLQSSANRRYIISSVARDVALNAYGIEYEKKYSGFF